MRHYLLLTLATLALVAAAPSAFATHVIFDPPATSSPGVGDCTLSSGGLNNYTPCNVSQPNTPYDVAFVDCSTLSGLNPAASGWCLYMTNVTGQSLTKFTFQFTAPSGGSSNGSDVLQCSSQPPGFATNNCQNGATVAADQSLDVSFFALLPNNTNFYLITDFVNQPGPSTVTVSVPEPGELGLFGLGLLALGVGYGLRKRRQVRSNQAA